MEKMAIGQPAAVAIAVGLVRTFGSACGMGFVQRFGRRKSLIFSSGIASILLASVSLLLQVRAGLPDTVFNWCMISLLVFVMYSNSVGMTPVPWILCGEWPDFQHKVSLDNFTKYNTSTTFNFFTLGYCQCCWYLPVLCLSIPCCTAPWSP